MQWSPVLQGFEGLTCNDSGHVLFRPVQTALHSTEPCMQTNTMLLQQMTHELCGRQKNTSLLKIEQVKCHGKLSPPCFIMLYTYYLPKILCCICDLNFLQIQKNCDIQTSMTICWLCWLTTVESNDALVHDFKQIANH